jgi:hypothetical protein
MNPLVVQILGGLLVIVYIVFLVMCWKTWRVWHIIFSFLVFAAAGTFLVFGACTLKTHAAWQILFDKYTKAVDRAEAEHQKLLYGDPLTIEQKEDSIRSVLAELNHVVVHRGRIWRGCTPKESPDPNTIRVSTVPANLPADAKPKPNNIKDKLILYVFTEADTPEGPKVPVAYLGEFAAKDPSDTEVSLSPTLPLDPDQIEKIKAGGTTWALYELAPLDGYELFAALDPKENLLVGMEKEELKKFIPNQFGWSEEQYNKFLDAFYRFDRPATENDPPENVWVQVKFLKEHVFVVDATTEQSPLEADKFFDSSGRAVMRNLRRGENGEVKFTVGSLGIFDPTTAEKELIGPGICEKVRLLYRRPLHDYTHFFRESFRRHIELDDSIRRARRGAEEMVALAAKAKEQQAFHEVEKVKLQQELVRFRQENVDVVGYGKRLDAEWQALVQRLSQLYRTNIQLAEELKRLQYQHAAAINQRAAAPAAPPPSAPPVP